MKNTKTAKMYEYNIVEAMEVGKGKSEIKTGVVMVDFGTYKIYVSIEDEWLKIYKTDCPAINSIVIKPEVSNVILIS